MNKILLVIIFSQTLLFVFIKLTYAKIVINEVLNNPTGEEAGAEWVEIYNTENTPKSLKDCVLYLDANTASQVVKFGDEDFVDKYKVVTWDLSWLNNNGDTIKIECGTEVDLVAYGDEINSIVEKPREGVTFGRSPDGLGNFTILSSVTLGEANSAPPTNTPLPTNTNTPTPKPTSTLTPTPTPKATSTSTPKPTFTPTKKPTDKPDEVTAQQSSENTDDLTGIVKSAQVEAGDAQETESGEKSFPVAAFVLVAIGTALLGTSLVPIIKNLKKKI